jgi:hypothetical protein
LRDATGCCWKEMLLLAERTTVTGGGQRWLSLSCWGRLLLFFKNKSPPWWATDLLRWVAGNANRDGTNDTDAEEILLTVAEELLVCYLWCLADCCWSAWQRNTIGRTVDRGG